MMKLHQEAADPLEQHLADIDALLEAKEYPHGRCAALVQDHPARAEVWFAWIKVFMAGIRDKKLVCCVERYTGPDHRWTHYRMDQLYANALRLASPTQIAQLQRQWDTFWHITAEKVRTGEYLLDLADGGGRISDTLSVLHNCGPAAAQLVAEGEQNARLLRENGLRWGRTSFSGPEGWLPWKPLSGSDLGVSFLLGRQLRWRDYLSGSDQNGGVTVLSVPLSLAGPALEDCKKQAEAAGKQLRRSGLCPYCGNQLKNDLLGKTCPYCASH
ncbi:MAG TPA: hypothetical protein H9795_07170 [Candidatus Fournierella merdigallinarum]|nr:hypothetical protein [Candidatus Fournierella merdigallinarum]